MALPSTVETILVATDFSEDAAAALDWAATVARERGARIVLAHSAMITAPAAPEFIRLDGRFYGEMRAIAKKRLDDLAEGFRKAGLPVEAELLAEPVVASILSLAERCSADVIVAGTRGLTGWKRLVLGSVAARLIRHAQCPVVTLHSADAKRHRPVRKILIATDFSEDAALAADAAARVLGEGGSDRKLVLLHVYHYPVVLSHEAPPAVASSVEEVVESAGHQLAAIAARICREDVNVEFLVDQGLPSQAIIDQARRIDADLIAMGTQGRSGIDRLFIGSTAERVLSAAPCPVLTVRMPTR